MRTGQTADDLPMLRGRWIHHVLLACRAPRGRNRDAARPRLVRAGSNSTEPDYCSQLSATEEAYDDLASTDVLAEGTDTLSDRYETFSTQVDKLLDSAQAEFSEESDSVRDAVDQVDGVVESAAELNLGDAAAQLEPALSSLQTSTTALFTAVTEAC